MSERHRRLPNFTVHEENVLRILTAKYRNVIEEKGSNARVRDRKSQAWVEIEKEFRSTTKVERLAARLRSKYEMMKKHNKLQIDETAMKEEKYDRKTAPNQESFASELLEKRKKRASKHVLKEKSLSPQPLVIDLKYDSASTSGLTLNTGPYDEKKMCSVMTQEFNDAPEASSNLLNAGPCIDEKNISDMTNLGEKPTILHCFKIPSKRVFNATKQEPNSSLAKNAPERATSSSKASLNLLNRGPGIDQNNMSYMSNLCEKPSILHCLKLPSRPVLKQEHKQESNSSLEKNAPKGGTTSSQASSNLLNTGPGIESNLGEKPPAPYCKQEPNSSLEWNAPKGASSSSQAALHLLNTGLGIDENNNSDTSKENQLIEEQLTFYRNKELRALQKHLAELTNLELQKNILEIELQIKKEELHNNYNKK